MNTKKVIIAIAATLGIIYLLSLVKKKKCNCADKTKPCNCNDSAPEVGSNVTGTREVELSVPKQGAPGARTTVVFKDTTRNRCTAPDGRTFYVNGPCPR
jgi:hypothetical protein